ncbi:hypothetical protein JTE90_006105 [Oedothorax gibbosus]|uniref:Iron-binding zinc finger CDGSH type domain-containing protein n=1 Tax=Oedothorax gibbosus TaxID=931172 RepID=A0AAV6V618_9ARAC|nr:hypothetical protein JTE90_006105 [Oedothorax gibbosus]
MSVLNCLKRFPLQTRALFVNPTSKFSSEVVVKGVIAKRIPTYIELKADKTYAWCSCGLSKKQPFCDGSHQSDPNGLKPVKFTVAKAGRYLLCRCKQTNNRPYCDLTHVKTFIPESIRNMMKIKL